MAFTRQNYLKFSWRLLLTSVKPSVGLITNVIISSSCRLCHAVELAERQNIISIIIFIIISRLCELNIIMSKTESDKQQQNAHQTALLCRQVLAGSSWFVCSEAYMSCSFYSWFVRHKSSTQMWITRCTFVDLDLQWAQAKDSRYIVTCMNTSKVWMHLSSTERTHKSW